VGLNPVGIGLIVGTFYMIADPALQGGKGKPKESAIEKAVIDYFIADTGSVAAAVDTINNRAAAKGAVARHNEPTSDQMRVAIAQEVFQQDVLEGYDVKAERVNAHAHEQRMRMWSLE